MPSRPRRWKFRIRHILDAIAQNLEYLQDVSYEQFTEDSRTLKAIVWNLTVIGEAARHIPPQVEIAYPAIPWPAIRGMRNHIVHEYDTIDFEVVWKVVHDELPPLVPEFERILQEEPE
jgi:uncharacterized protein with HEPN domain